MAKYLIVGDSQGAGPPGVAAERRLTALGHTVRRIGNSGRGPYDYVRTPDLWTQYTQGARDFRPDHVLLIFGSNDIANANLERALGQMKSGVAPPVWLSGPPRYEDAEAQARGQAIHDMNLRVFTAARYIDAYPWTGPEVPRAPDGLHFTSGGGAAWGVPLADEFARRVAAGGAVRLPFVGGASPVAAVVTALLGTAALGVIVALVMRRR
jgi:lysophospholipase L1-like esterase